MENGAKANHEEDFISQMPGPVLQAGWRRVQAKRPSGEWGEV